MHTVQAVEAGLAVRSSGAAGTGHGFARHRAAVVAFTEKKWSGNADGTGERTHRMADRSRWRCALFYHVRTRKDDTMPPGHEPCHALPKGFKCL
jgi:hypothetical protein